MQTGAADTVKQGRQTAVVQMQAGIAKQTCVCPVPLRMPRALESCARGCCGPAEPAALLRALRGSPQPPVFELFIL